MYLKKAQAGSAPGHIWDHDGQVIEVADDLAGELLRIPGGGFSEAMPHEIPQEAPEEPEEAPEEPGEEAEGEDTPKRRGGRPRLPRDENGNIIRTEITE